MNAAVVLAAGASSRLGAPKALVPLNGEPAVVRVVRVAKESGCDPVIVVVGADGARIAKAVPKGTTVVTNTEWASGRTGSVKVGLAQLSAQLDALVWPVDHPAVGAPTIRAVLMGRGTIRVPVLDGRRGHPTFFARTVLGEIRALGNDQPLHDVLHARPERVVEVPVQDLGIHLNLDTPEDLRRIEAHLGGGKSARPVV